jgi:hypothetical protein
MYEAKLLSLYSNNVFNKKGILTKLRQGKIELSG